MTSDILNATSDSEIVTTRVLNFPQKLVFKAWSDPEHLQNWWGQKVLLILFRSLTFAKAENGDSSCMVQKLEIMPMNANSSK